MKKKLSFLCVILFSLHMLVASPLIKEQLSNDVDKITEILEQKIGSSGWLLGSGLGFAGTLYFTGLSLLNRDFIVVWLKEFENNEWPKTYVLSNLMQVTARTIAAGLLAIASGKLCYTCAKKSYKTWNMKKASLKNKYRL